MRLKILPEVHLIYFHEFWAVFRSSSADVDGDSERDGQRSMAATGDGHGEARAAWQHCRNSDKHL